MSVRQNHRQLFTALIVFIGCAAAFQNCANPVDYKQQGSQKAAQARGGEGYDGKVYVRRGTCGTDPNAIISAIRIEAILGDSYFVRENCQDVPAKTKFVDVAKLTLAPQGVANQIQYDGVVFDVEAASTPTPTPTPTPAPTPSAQVRLYSLRQEIVFQITTGVTTTVGGLTRTLVAGETYSMTYDEVPSPAFRVVVSSTGITNTDVIGVADQTKIYPYGIPIDVLPAGQLMFENNIIGSVQ